MPPRLSYLLVAAFAVGCGDQPVGLERSPETATVPSLSPSSPDGGVAEPKHSQAGDRPSHYLMGRPMYGGPSAGTAPGAQGIPPHLDEPELYLSERGSGPGDALLIILDSPTTFDWAWGVNGPGAGSAAGVMWLMGGELTMGDQIDFYPDGSTRVNNLDVDGSLNVNCRGSPCLTDGRLSVGNLTVAALTTPLCADASGESLIGRCTASSIRFKEDVADLDRGLETIRELRPVTFRWKSDGREDLGFIAEEVAEVDPLLATYEEDMSPSGVKYPHMVALLTKGIQELTQTVDQQRQEIEQLQTLVAELRRATYTQLRENQGGSR